MALTVGNDVYLVGGHNGSAAVSVIYRAPTYMFARTTTADVSANPSWRTFATDPSNVQDSRIGTTLTANNICSMNSSGTALNCTTSSTISANMLDFNDFNNAMTLDASTDILETGSNTLSITHTGTAYSFVINDQAADSSPFAIASDGKVGIKALIPVVALDVGGAIVSRAKDAASATSIDFTQGNVVYTAATCGAFTLTGMQDGGQYTLVVKGDGAGPATFTHAGLTVRTYGTMGCTSGRQMTFTFIRAGTDVYVSHITGF